MPRYLFLQKNAPEADTVGTFFGLQNSSCEHRSSDDGIHYVCIQVDLYSKWSLRLGMQTVGFVEGNVLDMIIVDWPGRAVLASSQITVTSHLKQMLNV